MRDDLDPRPVQVGQPSEWVASDIPSLSSIAFQLEDRHVEQLEVAHAEADRKEGGLESLTREDFPLGSLRDDLRRLVRELQTGRGIVVLEGLPVQEWPIEKTELVLLGLAAHLGTPQAQSVLGDFIGHVRNVGGTDTRERGYRNSVAQPLHTDFSHGFLGMLSIRTAATGGESLYASAVTVHNLMCTERPDLMPPLYQGFHYHRLDSALPGEDPVTPERIPTFSVVDGVLSCRYARPIIEAAMDELGENLPARSKEALDFLDSVASRPEVPLETLVQPGQFVVANDFVTLHSRRAFEDAPGEGNGRLFLRTWVKPDTPRPRVPEVDAVPTFERREGGSTYYQGKSEKVGGLSSTGT